MGGDGDDILVAGDGVIGYDYWQEKQYVYPDGFSQGNDTLDGGAGNDTIHLSRFGTQTVIFGRGYGHDLVVSPMYSPEPANAVVRLVDLNQADVDFSGGEYRYYENGYDIIITIRETGETLTLQGAFMAGAGPDGHVNRIAGLEFADGYLTLEEIIAQYPEIRTFNGTEAGDDMYLPGSDIAVHGLGGDDSLFSSGRRNKLYGGDGNDTLVGNDHGTYLEGGSGDDIFSVGSGHDVINAFDRNEAKFDLVRISWDYSPENINFSVELNSDSGLYDLVMMNLETGQTVRILSAISSSGQGQFNPYGVEAIEFWNGTFTLAELYNPAWFDGLPGGGRFIVGHYSGGELNGTDGNDIMHGLSENDQLYGGAGDDTMYAGGGVDLLDGGAGNDVLHVTARYNDENIVVFGRGYGHDTVVGDHYAYEGRTTINLAGLNLEDVSLSFADDELGYKDLIITIVNTSESLTVSRGLQGYGAEPWNCAGTYFKGIQFADQYLDWNGICVAKGWTETLDGSAEDDYLYASYRSGGSTLNGFEGHDHIEGGWGQDAIYGGDGDDAIYGHDGDDLLFGGDGNDEIDGGVGNNYLQGGAGDDTYLCSSWWGGHQDTINNSGGGNDLLKLDYVNPAELWFGRDNQDLNIRLIGNTYQITVQDWFAEGDYKIDTIVAGDYSITENQVAQMVQALAAFGTPAGVDGQWTEEQREALAPVLTAHWQPTM